MEIQNAPEFGGVVCLFVSMLKGARNSNQEQIGKNVSQPILTDAFK